MSRLNRYLVLVPLIALGLLVGAASAQAAHFKLFHPPHAPLSKTKIVKSTHKHITRMDDKGKPTKNFVRYSSKKNSKLVAKLNDKRQQRNQFRNDYLQNKLAQYKNDKVNPIFRLYNDRVEAAKAEYRRDIRRINEKKESPRKKRAAKARAARDLRDALTIAARRRNISLDRANRQIAETRRENVALYQRISARDRAHIKQLKGRLRESLARLRNRLHN
jgi:hypothetical protein